jgi:hypothetical protein
MHVTVQLPNADSHDCRAFNSILARVARQMDGADRGAARTLTEAIQ